MSATAIRSGELLAVPAALRRGPPVASASVVAFRLRAPVAGRVAVRVVAAAAEGAGVEAEAEAEGKPKPKKKRAASGIMKPKPISPELREFVGGAAELPRTEALKIIWAHIKGNNLQGFIRCKWYYRYDSFVPATSMLFVPSAWILIINGKSRMRNYVVYGQVNNRKGLGEGLCGTIEYGPPMLEILNPGCNMERGSKDPENKKIIVCDEKLKKIFGGRERVGFLEISGLLNPHFQK
ncbi:hypothetical protein TRIUR3_21019 [Triticum urartu]|uniref:DM2 domain-containing protein n=1 Tax=Triticum urartu TaxID=4572 RepID=M7YUD2_TRIUA|nr:hypothetical protein TRIUR3_21019 [Triticum urartu]